MMELLAPDVVCWTDGGGKVTAARRPMEGADQVAHWLLRVLAKPSVAGFRFDVASINGEPGLLTTVGGQPAGAIAFEFAGDRIVGLRVQVNPEKLRGLSR